MAQSNHPTKTTQRRALPRRPHAPKDATKKHTATTKELNHKAPSPHTAKHNHANVIVTIAIAIAIAVAKKTALRGGIDGNSWAILIARGILQLRHGIRARAFYARSPRRATARKGFLRIFPRVSAAAAARRAPRRH